MENSHPSCMFPFSVCIQVTCQFCAYRAQEQAVIRDSDMQSETGTATSSVQRPSASHFGADPVAVTTDHFVAAAPVIGIT